jgi:hypothetical protein
MSYLGHPEGVTGNERVFSSVDTTRLVTVCPCGGCDFDGEVDADVFLLVAGPTSRTLEYQWTCPDCETEVVEEREERDGEDQ